MNFLDSLAVGAVRCVFSTAPAVTIRRVLAWGRSRTDGDRIAICDADLSRPVSAMIDSFVASLARAAMTVWPDWYGRSNAFAECDEASLQSIIDRLATIRETSLQRSVLRPWLLAAVSMARMNELPILPDFSAAVQLQQLALAIADRELVLMARAASVGEPEPTGLLGLARNLEWLSRHVPARIAAVLPAVWAGRPELDGMTWECLTVDEADEAGEANPFCVETESPLDEPPVMVCPIRGRPHPNSPGEQLMASRLRLDPLLGPLFEYNMPVATVRGSRYQVDLVWFGGKLVVEIDGYRAHSSRFDFANDRHRDYELQLSGYLVLRLTHENVMRDIELEIDKIRDMVKLRMGQPLLPEPSV